MRGVQRIAEQHDVLKAPATILHQQKIHPARIVRQQLVPAEIAPENFREVAARLRVGKRVELRCAPCFGVALDDEGTQLSIEFVRVRREDARLRLAKRQRQAVKKLACAVPDIFICPLAQDGLEACGVMTTDFAVDAVRADEQIASLQAFNV